MSVDDIIGSGPPTVASSIAMGILASITVVLRFMVKIETRTGLTMDDYWISVSLATYWAYAGVMIWSIFDGGGGLDMRNFVQGNKAGITIYLQVTVNTRQ
jgi:hypothetical protein